jgi:hypothetical protein
MISTQRTLAAALLIAAAAVSEGAQAQIASEKGATRESTGKHYVLPANKDTAQWGWLDPAEKPKLVVDSGDTVSIETLSHSMDEIKPGVSVEEIVNLRLANPGGGPHSVTGPIYVNGAEPGDTLEIRIKKIVMKESGFNFNLPGKQFPTVGLLANEFPEGHVQYFKLDTKTMTTEFKPGIHPATETLPWYHRRRPRPQRAKRESRTSDPRRQRAAPALCDPGKMGPTWT